MVVHCVPRHRFSGCTSVTSCASSIVSATRAEHASVRNPDTMTTSAIDANRREIADAACDLVADGGLDTVSMRRIARHLGSTTGYISHYYADKEDLLEAALRSALDTLTTRLGEPSASLEEWLDTASAILPGTEESQRFWRVLMAFQAASLNSTRLSEVLRHYAANNEAALAVHLTAVVPADAPDAEVLALARALFALVAGLGTSATITPGAFSGRQQRAVVRAAVSGLVEEFTSRYTDGC